MVGVEESDEFNEERSIFIWHRQKETLDALKAGEIESVQVSAELPVDKIVSFGLKEGFLKQGLQLFPDPRKRWEVPIDVALLPQVLQRLNDEHSLLLAPYMLNSADLITELGYNVQVLNQGFNDKAKYPRQTVFHGETLKHILNASRVPKLLEWFNSGWLPIWRQASPGRTRQYLLDGTKIKIRPQALSSFEGAGVVGNDKGEHEYGYKVVFLYEIIDKKGVIVGINIGPINRHDIELGKDLIASFAFEEGSSLIMDRGFIDGEWITHLKKKRGVDVFIPLRHNMELTQAAIVCADNRTEWKDHPTREGQKIYEVKKEDLYWKECELFESGVLVRWWQKDGKPDEVLFVTTNEKCEGKDILRRYDQRAEIEEANKQIKCFQGLETLLSRKFVHVVFRTIMSVIGYNLMNLFLNSENCDTFEQYSIKTMRQKRRFETNPKVIIYTKTTFAVLKQFEFLPIILQLKKSIREKLVKLFKNLDPSPAPC
jgi:hypothetical protein